MSLEARSVPFLNYRLTYPINLSVLSVYEVFPAPVVQSKRTNLSSINYFTEPIATESIGNSSLPYVTSVLFKELLFSGKRPFNCKGSEKFTFLRSQSIKCAIKEIRTCIGLSVILLVSIFPKVSRAAAFILSTFTCDIMS